jgi:hypothetical protein
MSTDAERPRPPIVKRCAVCGTTLDAQLYPWAVGVVSPSGVEHIGWEATEWEIFAGHTLTHTEAQELRDHIETIVKHETRK